MENKTQKAAHTLKTGYYAVNTTVNGAALSLFVALTCFFPFVMDLVYQELENGKINFASAKYGNITITKKIWFIAIAVIGCFLVFPFAALVTHGLKEKSPKSYERKITISARNGISSSALDAFRMVRLISGILTAAFGAACLYVLPFISSSSLSAIFYAAFSISAVLFLSSFIICHVGTPRAEQVLIKTESAFIRFLRSLTLPDVAIILYWVFMFISCLRSDSPIESFIGLEKRNNGFFIQTLYIAVYFVISRGTIFKKLNILLLTISGTVISFVGILHYFGIDLYKTGYGIPRWQVELYALKADRTSAGTNFLGSIGNINLLSYVIVLCLVASVLLYVVNTLPSWDKYGLFTLLCCFIMAFGERCTRTDAGIVAIIGAAFFAVIVLCNSMERLRRLCLSFGIAALGWSANVFIVKHHLQKVTVDTTSKALLCGSVILIAAGIILYLLSDKVDKVNPRIIRFGSWGTMALGVVAVCVLAIYAAKTQTSGTFYEFGQILLGNFAENFGNARGKIWMKSVHLIKEDPLFGIGPDRFATIFKEKLGVLFKGKVLDKAHNEYLDVLICNGIIGLGLFMTFLIGLLTRAVKRSKESPCAGVMAVVIFAYMVHAFFGYQLPLQSPVVWAVLGLAGSACFAVNDPSFRDGEQN